MFDRLKAECDDNMVGSAAASSEEKYFHFGFTDIMHSINIHRMWREWFLIQENHSNMKCISSVQIMISLYVDVFLFLLSLQEKRGPLLHCLARVLLLFGVSDSVAESDCPGSGVAGFYQPLIKKM